MLKKFARWIERQKIHPKTWVVIMFFAILACVVAQVLGTFLLPRKKVVLKESPLRSPFNSKSTINPATEKATMSYEEVVKRAQQARDLISSGKTLNHADSSFIVETYDIINEYKKNIGK